MLTIPMLISCSLLKLEGCSHIMDLYMTSGRDVMLVGENGSGKSSFVKVRYISLWHAIFIEQLHSLLSELYQVTNAPHKSVPCSVTSSNTTPEHHP